MDTRFSLFLRQKILGRGTSISQFAKEAEISRRTLHNLLDGSVAEAKFKTLLKLAIALGIHPQELLSLYVKSIDFTYDDASSISERADTLINGDDIGFIEDMTIPDGSTVSACATFEKIWNIQNTGSVHWQGRSLICVNELLEVRGMDGRRVIHGLRAAKQRYPVPDLTPGERVELAIRFTAPCYPCTVISCWKMVDANGELCFPKNEPLSCLVRVIAL